MNEIDLDTDLGDASEVYAIRTDAALSFSIHGQNFTANDDSKPAGKLFVDEIHDGRIYLYANAEEGQTEYATGATLEPENARQLAYALLRAADYADRQRKAKS